MIHAVEDSTRRLSVRLSHGRVINAISALLRQQLSVPHVYLKPRVPGSSGIDVLAVDRGGSGDVYGVQIVQLAILPTETGIRKWLAPLKALPVHYRYLAIQASADTLPTLRKLDQYEALFDSTGIGRIGILAYDERLLDPSAKVDSTLMSVIVQPERFRVRGEQLAKIERFLANAKPDMEVRI
ncbi:MAG TPA: hypothetical protein VII58_09710 [Acidobacteriaceae bacterium]